MRWLFLPAAGILICLVGMSVVMGAIGFLSRRRSQSADDEASANSETPDPTD
jgi:hypothetical protein